MAQFKDKKKSSFWHSPLALLVFFLVLVLFSYNMIGLIAKERETSKNKAAELNKIEELRAREASLKSEISRLNTDEGIEESVRDKFQVVKPGEKMVVIVDEDKDKNDSVPVPVDHSFWGFIKIMFGK